MLATGLLACVLVLTLLVGLVQWAEVQVHQFAETFRRQVYGPTSDPVVIEESLTSTVTCITSYYATLAWTLLSC